MISRTAIYILPEKVIISTPFSKLLLISYFSTRQEKMSDPRFVVVPPGASPRDLAVAMAALRLAPKPAKVVVVKPAPKTKYVVVHDDYSDDEGPEGYHRVENGGVGICGATTKSGYPCENPCGPRGGPCHLHNGRKAGGYHSASKGGVGVCGARKKSGGKCQNPCGPRGGKCHLHR